MKRDKKIKSGRLWQVYPSDNADCILFEGSKNDCWRFIRVNCPTAYKKGTVRLAKLIYENIQN